MSKLSSFVRKYGDEIGVVGKIIFSFITKIPLDLNDRKTLTEEAQKLIDASKSIAASYREIEKALPGKKEIEAAVKAQLPSLVQTALQTVVADLVKAEIEKLLGVGDKVPDLTPAAHPVPLDNKNEA